MVPAVPEAETAVDVAPEAVVPAAPEAETAVDAAPPFPAVEWTREYADTLRSELAKVVVNPMPDAENRIVVRAGEILLSGDIAPSADPPTVVLDGGALHFSHGAAALREAIDQCERFVAEANGDETRVPKVLPARREVFRNPIAVTKNGGWLDHDDRAFATLVGPIGLAPGTSSGVLDVFGLTEIVIDRRALADSRLEITGCGQVADVTPGGLVRNRRWFEDDNPLRSSRNQPARN